MRSGEVKQLTGIRGVAAIVVMVAHINGGRLPWLQAFAYQSQAVDLFFCLSSFILCLTYSAGSGAAFPMRRFYAARFARIYPLYFAALVATAGISVVVFPGFATYPDFESDFARQLSMLNAWPVIGHGVHWDAAAWSVSVEAFCYVALFPILFALSSQAASFVPSARLMLMLSMGAVGAIIGYWWLTADVFSWTVPRGTVPAMAFWSPVVRGASMFTAGWLAYIAYSNRDRLSAALQRHADAFVLLVLALIALTMAKVLPSWAALPLFAPLLIALMNGDGLAARLLASKPVYRLGVLSYSLYLVHFPVMYALRPVEGRLAPWLYVPVAIAISAAVAVLAYRCIEYPARTALRDWLNRRPAQAA